MLISRENPKFAGNLPWLSGVGKSNACLQQGENNLSTLTKANRPKYEAFLDFASKAFEGSIPSSKAKENHSSPRCDVMLAASQNHKPKSFRFYVSKLRGVFKANAVHIHGAEKKTNQWSS